MPFNSTEKFALTIVELLTETSDFCVFVKGAPEKIWQLCSEILNEQATEPKTNEWERNFADTNQ